MFERGLGDLQAIEEEIAAAIAQKFRISFRLPAHFRRWNRAARAQPVHDGAFHANKRTIQGLESLRCYEQAITIPATYAGLCGIGRVQFADGLRRASLRLWSWCGTAESHAANLSPPPPRVTRRWR